jgi:DhnA family fructose-bisphosphate aldolase class Ia
MSKSGRALRLGRLFKADETPLFLVPLDHTVTDGPFTDAHGYDALLGILADNGADAIVVHKGRLRLLPRRERAARTPRSWPGSAGRAQKTTAELTSSAAA